MMLKLYIVVWSNSINVEAVKKLFDEGSNSEFWFIFLPQSMFVKSMLTAGQINDLMTKRFGETEAFFITEIVESNFAGRSPDAYVEYFKNTRLPTPRLPPKK